MLPLKKLTGATNKLASLESSSSDLLGFFSHKMSIYYEAHIEPILSNKDKRTLKGVNSLPNTSDDFFLDGRIDTKSQERKYN